MRELEDHCENMALEFKLSQTGGDRGVATRKTTDYNKAAVYLKQIIHSIECSGKIGAIPI